MGELCTLCELLGLPSPPIVGPPPWDGLPEEAAARLREANADALVARRVLTDDEDGNLAANEAVARILAVACQPQLAIRESHEQEGWIQTRFVACVPQVSIELIALRSHVVRLVPFLTDGLLQRIVDFTDLKAAPEPQVGATVVPIGAFEAAAGAVKESDADGAVAALVEAGVDVVVAEAIAVSLEKRSGTARIELLHRPAAGEAAGLELSWLGSDAGLWVLDTVRGDDGEVGAVRFEPTTRDMLIDQFLQALPAELATQLRARELTD